MNLKSNRIRNFLSISIGVLLAFFLTAKFSIYTRPNGRAFVIFKTKNFKHYDIVVYKNPLNDKLSIARIIAIPGDTVKLTNAIAFINNKKEKLWKDEIFLFTIFFDDKFLKNKFKKYKVIQNTYCLSLNTILKYDTTLLFYKKLIVDSVFYQRDIFPFSFRFRNNSYFIKSFVCPYKGMKVKNTIRNKSLYRFLLKKYEMVDFRKTFFVFKNNYYFLLNDRRCDIRDSRTLGPIPEKLIQGKIIFYLKK